MTLIVRSSDEIRARSSILARFGVRPVINASGIYTDLGGSVLDEEVWAAATERARRVVPGGRGGARVGHRRVHRALHRGEAASAHHGRRVPACAGGGHVKGAHLHEADTWALKVASGFPRNAAKGLAVGSGLSIVLSAQTGYPARSCGQITVADLCGLDVQDAPVADLVVRRASAAAQ